MSAREVPRARVQEVATLLAELALILPEGIAHLGPTGA